ncbi:FAD-dependent oxidoreductase [Microbacterium sp. NPDC055357]
MSGTDAYDIVVLGSGATGLTAALTAAIEGSRVALFEKNDRVGGTSAWSGGHVWIPANPHIAEHGIEDSVENGVTYLLAVGRGLVDERLIRAFVENGHRMVTYLEQNADLEFYSVPGLPDYHPEHPGGKPEGGRTLGTPLFPFAELGLWQDRVEVTPYYSPHFRMDETGIGAGVPKPPSTEELERRAADDERGQGGSLIGFLLRAALAAGVHIETSTAGVELVVDEGRVSGAVVEGGDGRRVVRATRGVILATGGFEWNEEYRTAFLRGAVHKPASIPTNTGDGLRMAMKVGAALQNMREAWWIPIAILPPGINDMDLDMINGDRTRPRSIMVNRRGRRFANEAANYNAFGGAFHQEDVAAFGYANIPAWIIHDHTYLKKYGSRGVLYDGTVPPWLTSAPTLRQLAENLGIDAGELDRTVRDWNEAVAKGEDPEFHRGQSAHDRWWGDPWNKGTAASTLGPLTDGPFYAMELRPGTIGTKGGPKVDVHSRVIDHDGDVIEGLYAAGNTSSPTGTGYGGPGGTLGPNMTFAWLAAKHAASKPTG